MTKFLKKSVLLRACFNAESNGVEIGERWSFEAGRCSIFMSSLQKG